MNKRLHRMITFVTAFININQNKKNDSQIAWRIKHFLNLVKTGISICVYVDSTMEDEVKEIANTYPNVKVMKIIRLSDLFAYKVCSAMAKNLQLPYTDNANKDTKDYMIVQNSKLEFVKDAMDENPFQTDHFAWIDFSITYIFSGDEYIKILTDLNSAKINDSLLIIPGCWSQKLTKFEVLKSICWRFCGGFFLGDRKSLEEFYFLYTEHFPKFIAADETMVWEVNFWGWLECSTSWSPTWYLADHDIRIINNVRYIRPSLILL